MSLPRLGLDTATPFLSLALWWPVDERVAREHRRVDRRLAAELAPAIAAFLRRHGVTPGDLGGIGVGVGPGSYTGARVGVAWALGAGRALGIPVVGGDTLAALATAVVSPGGHGQVAVAARRGEAWCGTWSVDSGGQPRETASRRPCPLAQLPDAALASLDQPPDASWHARSVDHPDPLSPRVRYHDRVA